jgi:hypothetical protein
MYSQKVTLPIWRNYPLDKAHIPDSEDLIQLKKMKSEILALKKQMESRNINTNFFQIETQLVTKISTFKECYSSKILNFENPITASTAIKNATNQCLKEAENTLNPLLDTSCLTENRTLNINSADEKFPLNPHIQEYIEDTEIHKNSENENIRLIFERKLQEQNVRIKNLEDSLVLQDNEIKTLRSDIDKLLQQKLTQKIEKDVKTKPRFRFFSSGYSKLN